MKKSRLFAALPLVLAIAGVPMAVWFALGRRQLATDARQRELQARADNRALAERLANRLTGRLRALRDFETQRPYYHYQALYHDPRGAAEGIAVVPSPLTQAPADPLVVAYFQIAPDGELTMPALSEEVPGLTGRDAASALRPLLADYRRAGPKLAATMPDLTGRHGDIVTRSGPQPAGAGSTPPRAHLLEPQQTLILSRGAWMQNAAAAGYFLRVRGGAHATSPAVRALPRPPEGEGIADETVVIESSWLYWRTVIFRGQPALFALRQVLTPDGVWTQGFQVDMAQAGRELQALAPVATQLVYRDAPPDALTVDIGGAGWRLWIDPEPALALARVRDREDARRFYSLFLLAAAAVALAGGLVLYEIRSAEKLAEQRSRFAAAAAHELRTPLAGLRLYGDMLAGEHGDPARAREYARRISDEAARLARVVGNVLEFTRLERGIPRVSRRSGDLAAALRETAERMRPALESAGARLVLDLDAPLPALAFDADAVSEIAQNLLDNAEKYSRGAVDRTITLSAAPGAGGAEFSVRDRGPGLPAGGRDLFEPFTRHAPEGGPDGLGLGLALVRALARAHGGEVRAENAPGGGARFTVTLPS